MVMENIVQGFDDTPGSALRCLWLAREVPFPINSGDRTYSANLLTAFAQSGAEVHFLGLAEDGMPLPTVASLQWHPVHERKRPYAQALFSGFPLVTAAHATRHHRGALAELLTQRWDAIVLDHYGSGWALDAVLRHRRSTTPAPVLVHVSHNHEEALSHALYRAYEGSAAKRIYLYQNHLKTRHIERRLVRHVDIVATITDEDRQAYAQYAPGQRYLVLPPGFSGWRSPPRTIDGSTPKEIVLIGSFRWIVKTENLRRVVRIMDPIFARHGIRLNVVGDVPEQVLDELRPVARACRFLGFVDDVQPWLQRARIALVPEVVGGGFKLKLLDYIFGRVPVATIAAAAAGLPQSIQDNMLMATDLDALAEQIVANINNFAYLNSIQQHAYASAAGRYGWNDRGVELRNAIRSVLRSGSPAVPMASLALRSRET